LAITAIAWQHETAARTTWRKTIDLIRHGANELSAGLQVLEDAEAIRNLKARYAALCDNQYDADGIASLFTEDAVWESPALGRFEGREAIRSFFRGASAIFSFAIHYSLNGHIEVEGNQARARWYLFMPCTPPESRRCGAPVLITRLTPGWMELGCSATSGRSR
jgi:hypothetical protein